MQRCDLYFIVHSRAKVTSSVQTTLSGEAVLPRGGRGSDWSIHSVDLRPQRGKNVEVELAFAPTDEAFSRPEASIAVWLVMDRAVAEADGASSEDLPLPISSGFRRQTVEVLGETKLAQPASQRSLTAEQLKNVKAAKLRIVVFDSNGEPQYRDKFIYLNGEKLAAVPPNTGPLSAWQQQVIDLPAEHVGRLKLTNQVEVTNPAGDYFKFTGLSLAVRLADGIWVETGPQTQVYSSVAQWHYAEGTSFSDGRSGAIRLSFE
jgi:hypothetical protein